mgnify:FL=1|jgi:hypothetical protein
MKTLSDYKVSYVTGCVLCMYPDMCTVAGTAAFTRQSCPRKAPEELSIYYCRSAMPFTYYKVTYTGTEAVRDWRKRILAV